MKITKILLTFLVLGTAGNAAAQGVNLALNVECPLAITNNNTSINFGNVVAMPNAGGWAAISFNSTPSESYMSNPSGSSDPGAGNRGVGAGSNIHMTVTGASGFGWHFVNAPLTIDMYNGVSHMMVYTLYYNVPDYSNWGTGNQIPDPSQQPFHLSTVQGGGCGGHSDFWIGGTIGIPAGASSGVYTGTAQLTVSYE